MSYLDAVKKAIEAKEASKGQKSNIKYFKPEIGSVKIRFLPYTDPTNGLPWQEMYFYDCKKLSKYRMVAPSYFGEADPILDFYNDQRKTREGWLLVRDLKPRDRYFFNIVVRGKEADGPLLWEVSKDVKDMLQTALINEENAEEDIFSLESGFDFTLTVAQATDNNGKPRTFNGYAVKKFTLTQMRNKSPLSKDKAQVKSIMDNAVNIYENFKNMCPDNDKMTQALEKFASTLSSTENGTSAADELPVPSDEDITSANEQKLASVFGIS